MRPHPQWRILSIIYHRGEGWLQLNHSVTLIGHHHVPHSVLNKESLFWPISSSPVSAPQLVSEGFLPHLIPTMHLSKGTNSSQERCNLYHVCTSPNNVLPDISSCLPSLCICESRHWSSEPPCSYLMISSLSIAGSSPQWSQAEIQALHTPQWSSVFATLSSCNLQFNLLLKSLQALINI